MANRLLANCRGATSRCCWTSSSTPADRHWYAAAGLQHGWARKVLLAQIIGRLHQRVGAAPSNFARHLTERAREKDVETALMARVQEMLLEFGRGLSYVGCQVHFDVEG